MHSKSAENVLQCIAVLLIICEVLDQINHCKIFQFSRGIANEEIDSGND